MLCVKQAPERKSDRSNHPLTTANGNVTRHPENILKIYVQSGTLHRCEILTMSTRKHLKAFEV